MELENQNTTEAKENTQPANQAAEQGAEARPAEGTSTRRRRKPSSSRSGKSRDGQAEGKKAQAGDGQAEGKKTQAARKEPAKKDAAKKEPAKKEPAKKDAGERFQARTGPRDETGCEASEPESEPPRQGEIRSQRRRQG